jgi:hypothetical protein
MSCPGRAPRAYFCSAGEAAAVGIGAHAFLTASAATMAVAGTAFAFLPALRREMIRTN